MVEQHFSFFTHCVLLTCLIHKYSVKLFSTSGKIYNLMDIDSYLLTFWKSKATLYKVKTEAVFSPVFVAGGKSSFFKNTIKNVSVNSKYVLLASSYFWWESSWGRGSLWTFCFDLLLYEPLSTSNSCVKELSGITSFVKKVLFCVLKPSVLCLLDVLHQDVVCFSQFIDT